MLYHYAASSPFVITRPPPLSVIASHPPLSVIARSSSDEAIPGGLSGLRDT